MVWRIPQGKGETWEEKKGQRDKSTERTDANFLRQKRSRGFGQGILLRGTSQSVLRCRCQETLGPWLPSIRCHLKNQIWKRRLPALCNKLGGLAEGPAIAKSPCTSVSLSLPGSSILP